MSLSHWCLWRNTGGGTAVRRRTVCSASPIDTHQLRSRLNRLHLEASNTRAKANKARLRLMRLSEAAEKLQRQAVVSVQSGKENEARELLFQKKKTMQALEKTKSRIELLDELSRKLIEAISLQESQLVGTVALDLETEREVAAAPVRIVSPTENWGVDTSSDNDLSNSSDDREPGSNVQDKIRNVTGNLEGSLHGRPEPLSQHGSSVENKNDLMSGFKGVTSYEDLLDHVVRRLGEIEAELIVVVKFSTWVLERPENRRVQQVMEILDAVGRIRERIAQIMQTQVEMK